MSRYRNHPDAVRALVQPGRVHRDLYIDAELFALEQEHFFANTWNYLGHTSQIPKPGDYLTVNVGGQPLIVVRHSDKSVRVVMNRCAHKGSKLVSDDCGNTGKFFLCPYHAWTFKTDGSLLAIPMKNGYEGTGFADCEASRGLTTVRNVETYRGFIFGKINDVGPDFKTYFGESLSSIDNMADRSPEGELEVAGGCLRYMHNCNWKQFIENLNDTMHPMVVHESSAGTAKKLWAGHAEGAPTPMVMTISGIIRRMPESERAKRYPSANAPNTFRLPPSDGARRTTATATITAEKLAALHHNAVLTPPSAMATPANDGPTMRPRFHWALDSPTAATSCSRGTSRGRAFWNDGKPNALMQPARKLSIAMPAAVA